MTFISWRWGGRREGEAKWGMKMFLRTVARLSPFLFVLVSPSVIIFRGFARLCLPPAFMNDFQLRLLDGVYTDGPARILVALTLGDNVEEILCWLKWSSACAMVHCAGLKAVRREGVWVVCLNPLLALRGNSSSGGGLFYAVLGRECCQPVVGTREWGRGGRIRMWWRTKEGRCCRRVGVSVSVSQSGVADAWRVGTSQVSPPPSLKDVYDLWMRGGAWNVWPVKSDLML